MKLEQEIGSYNDNAQYFTRTDSTKVIVTEYGKY